MTDKQWLDKATVFIIDKDVKSPSHWNNIELSQALQIDGTIRWKVKCGNNVLSKKGYFIFDTLPSNRTDEYLNDTRFDSKEEAYKTYMTLKDAQKYNL